MFGTGMKHRCIQNNSILLLLGLAPIVQTSPLKLIELADGLSSISEDVSANKIDNKDLSEIYKGST